MMTNSSSQQTKKRIALDLQHNHEGIGHCKRKHQSDENMKTMERLEHGKFAHSISRSFDCPHENDHQVLSNDCSRNNGEKQEVTFQATVESRSVTKRHRYDETSCHYDIKRRKRIRKGKRRDINSLSDAIITCVPSLIKDVTFNEIEDRLIENGCLTADECMSINDLHDRKKQMRKVLIVIPKRSFETMSNFLDAIKPVYPYLVEKVWCQYNKNRLERPKRLLSRRLCPLCNLKDSVDVEKVIDELFGGLVIDGRLYAKINSSRKEVGQQHNLWDAVLKSCVKNQGIELLLASLETTDHYTHITKSLRYIFRNNRHMRQFCTCSKYILDRKITKLRTLSLESASSHSPRESSSSLSSVGSVINSDLETDFLPSIAGIVPCTRNSIENEVPNQEHAMLIETIELHDPLMHCSNDQKKTPKENPKREFPEKQELLKINISLKQMHTARYLTSCDTSNQRGNEVPNRLRRNGRFRSIVSAAMIKLRVLKQFKKKDKISPESSKHDVSEDMCETML